MSIQFTPDTPATRQAFNRLAREKMKLRLLADIRMDLMVCEMEGYSKLEYLDELLELVQELRKGGGGDGERGTCTLNQYHRKNFLFVYVSSSTAAEYDKQQKKLQGYCRT